MRRYNANHCFVLTGAMGAGKSTILREMGRLGITVVDEPARQILAEQRSIEGEGLPEKNEKLFSELLLSRAIFQYHQMIPMKTPVLFDRGIPDNMAYAEWFGLNVRVAERAAKTFRYHPKTFFLSGWKDIYVNDSERKMTFEQACQFGEMIKKIYQKLGYEIVTVPVGSPISRARFIVQSIFDLVLFENNKK
ncbi:hypothetical protein E3983_00030 [Legionella israelensis]|uniref:NadR/Ttd14 AAA domain-containing protein n=1 Tax=Legionella israelensis TaxID=454 RepID=A0AAX1ECM4_9GAMM|nr:AAA family ATPase [Legionella israelensis]QBR82885.1 hypothetical protein E3983_00030 [Legionella israelensis]